MQVGGRRPKVCLVVPYRDGSPEVVELRLAASDVSQQFDVELICQPAPMGPVRLGLKETLRNRKSFVLGGVQLGREALKRSNDLVVGFHPLHAILGSLVGLVFPHRGRPSIVALTVTVRPQGPSVTLLRALLYKTAFLNERLKLCCSSAVAIERLTESFPKATATFVPELIVQSTHIRAGSTPTGPQVFAGGYTGRDWSFLCEVAAHLPELTIRVMTSKESWGSHSHTPSNIDITFDDTKEQFDSALSTARVVVLTLAANEHSGFQVSRVCGLAGVALLWSSPSTLDEYRPNGYPVLERSDPKAAAELIRNVIDSASERQSVIEMLEHQWKVTLGPSAVLRQICETFLPAA